MGDPEGVSAHHGSPPESKPEDVPAARSNGWVVNGVIVLFGLLASGALQLLIAPAALIAALVVASEGNVTSDTVAHALVIGINLGLQGAALLIVAVVALVIKRLWLLQGWIIGALIGFLLYSACYGVFVSSL